MANEITYLWNNQKYEKNKGANQDLEKFLSDPKKSARNSFHALNINQEDIEQAMYNLNKQDESWSKAFPKGITRATGFVIKNQLDAYYNNYSETKPSEIFTIENIKKMSMPEISENVSELTKTKSLKGDLENIKDTSNESIFSLGRMGLIDLNDKGLNMSVDSKRVVSSESAKAFRDKVQAVNEKYSKEKAAENDDKDKKMSPSDVQKLVNDSNDKIQAFSREYYASRGGMPNYDNVNLSDYSSKKSDEKNAENVSKQRKNSEKELEAGSGNAGNNEEKTPKNAKQKSDGAKITAAAAAGAGAEVLLNNKKKNASSDQLTVTADTNKIGASNPLIPNQNNGAANASPSNDGNAPAAPSGESGSAGSNGESANKKNSGSKEKNKDSSDKNAEKNAKAQADYNNMLTKRKALEDLVVKKHYNASTKTFDMTPETLDKEIKAATDAANKAESNIKVKGSKATQKEIDDKEQKVATKNGLIRLRKMYDNPNYQEPYYYKVVNSRGGNTTKYNELTDEAKTILEKTKVNEFDSLIRKFRNAENSVTDKKSTTDNDKKKLFELKSFVDNSISKELSKINTAIDYANKKNNQSKNSNSSNGFDLENIQLNINNLNKLKEYVLKVKNTTDKNYEIYKTTTKSSFSFEKIPSSFSGYIPGTFKHKVK